MSTTSDRYLVAGTHPDTLDSGRPIVPGDLLPASAVNTRSDHDQHLIAAGVLIDLKEKS